MLAGERKAGFLGFGALGVWADLIWGEQLREVLGVMVRHRVCLRSRQSFEGSFIGCLLEFNDAARLSIETEAPCD